MRARSKYNAIQTRVDGFRFMSKREARRYQELKLLQKAGEIVGEIELQPPFPIYIADRYLEGVEHYIGKAIFDFLYVKRDGEEVVEDVKGVRTDLYRLKKKLVEAQYGIVVTEVR